MRVLGTVMALLLATPAALGTARAEERVLPLNEAIGMALEKNEGLVIEREGVAAAKSAVDASYGAYDQYLEMEGSWQQTEVPASSLSASSWIVPEYQSRGLSLGIRQLLPTGGALALRSRGARERTDYSAAFLSPAYGTQVGVELRQPLLRDLAIDDARFSVQVAHADRAGAQASLRRAVQETVAAVERAYWTLAAARLAVGVREEAVRLAEQQLEQTQVRIESGAVPHTELAQPRAELERRRGELFAGREASARAENALKLLILAEAEPAWSTAIVPSDPMEIEVAAADREGSVQSALVRRPELELVGAQLQRRRVETRFANNGVRPSLDAVASYDRFGLAGTTLGGSAAMNGGFDDSWQSLRSNDYNAARLSLVLGLPLRNSTARATADAARHVERQAQTEAAQARKVIRAEVLDAAAALETAGQRIEAARSGREAAEVQLAAEKDLYEAGQSTNFLVLTRQNQLSRARLDEISALTDYRTARTEMARADGTLIEARGIQLTDHKGK